MDPTLREIPNGALFIRDRIIEQVGTTAELTQTADETLDLRGRHIVLPGFVNTHHHFFQTLTKAAQAIGIRFHASRGSLSKSISQCGLAPDHVVENEAAISIYLLSIFAQVGVDSCAAMVYRCALLIQRSQHLCIVHFGLNPED
jgi:N-acyl-D-aspartate/D-glutamate deacylase